MEQLADGDVGEIAMGCAILRSEPSEPCTALKPQRGGCMAAACMKPHTGCHTASLASSQRCKMAAQL